MSRIAGMLALRKRSNDFVPGSECTDDRSFQNSLTISFTCGTPLIFFREATDTFTIAAPPGFGHLGDGRGLGSDLTLPLLSDKPDGKQDSSVKNLLCDGKLSDNLHQAATAPISQGCSLTQTVFNGTVLCLQYTSIQL
jgi:hypothetical protein